MSTHETTLPSPLDSLRPDFQTGRARTPWKANKEGQCRGTPLLLVLPTKERHPAAAGLSIVLPAEAGIQGSRGTPDLADRTVAEGVPPDRVIPRQCLPHPAPQGRRCDLSTDSDPSASLGMTHGTATPTTSSYRPTLVITDPDRGPRERRALLSFRQHCRGGFEPARGTPGCPP